MSLIDIFLVICVLLSGKSGYKHGFVQILTDILAFAGGAFLGVMYAPQLAELIISKVSVSVPVASVVSFFIIWGAVFLIMTAVGKLAQKVVGMPVIGTINKLIGFMVGALKGMVISIPFLILISYYKPTLITQSVLVKPFQKILYQLSTHFFESSRGDSNQWIEFNDTPNNGIIDAK
jgi:membrane protein required for colicin V production